MRYLVEIIGLMGLWGVVLGFVIQKPKKTNLGSVEPSVESYIEAIRKINRLSKTWYEPLKKPLPDDVKSTLDEMQDRIESILASPASSPSDEERYVLSETIRQYAPESIARYFLSKNFDPSGEPIIALREQIEILRDSVRRIDERCGPNHQRDDLTNFLRNKLG